MATAKLTKAEETIAKGKATKDQIMANSIMAKKEPPKKKALAKSALLVVTTLIRSGNEAIREPNYPPKSSPPDAAFAVLMATGPCYFWLPGDRLCHHTSWDQFLDR